MITPSAKITGVKNISDLLKELGHDALKDSQIKQGLRKLAKPIIQSIKSKAPVDLGTLKKSIGVIKGLRSRKGKPFILIGPRYYAPWNGFHAHLQEVGKEVYDVPFEGQKMVFNAWSDNRNRTINDLEKLLMQMLQKKLNKLNK